MANSKRSSAQLRTITENSHGPALPLPTLLSHALVAFTIESDNEFEHRMPHSTTNHGLTGARNSPWLGSLVLWSTCLRFVGDEGVRVGELERLARTPTNLNGMERWGYVVIAPDSNYTRSNPPQRDWVIRATPAGKVAREAWASLFCEIENRWQKRFGKEAIEKLRVSLDVVVAQLDSGLPDCLPIVNYGLFTKGRIAQEAPLERKDKEVGSGIGLYPLLAKVLLAFVIEFEDESELSLAICANILRVLDQTGVQVRDLPRLTGVSKELNKVSMGYLEKKHYIAVVTNPTAKATKLVRLTAKGQVAQDAYRKLLAAIEGRWQQRFGKDAISNLRESLELLVGEPKAQSSPLFRGLEPYPDGWRSSVPKPETLPHFPVVTHRGGYPDGS
jgi:DNA-binding MarR family transcriptional regulator